MRNKVTESKKTTCKKKESKETIIIKLVLDEELLARTSKEGKLVVVGRTKKQEEIKIQMFITLSNIKFGPGRNRPLSTL